MSAANPAPRHRWAGLHHDQARGQACVVCSGSTSNTLSIEVGVNEHGHPVRACRERCATAAAASILHTRIRGWPTFRA